MLPTASGRLNHFLSKKRMSNIYPMFRALEAFFKEHKFNKYCETWRLIWLMFVLHSMVNDIVKHFLTAGTCVNIISFWYFRNKLNNVKFTMTARQDKISGCVTTKLHSQKNCYIHMNLWKIIWFVQKDMNLWLIIAVTHTI